MAAEDDSDIPETGAVFTFGKSKFADNLPNKFWVRNDRVTQVACGDEHTVLVTESGRIFTFGRNDWGQLGLGNSSTADRPCCIKSLKHEKVKQVACGRSHTIVSTESGKLYSFGANGEGQLGVEDSPGSNTPKCIDSLIEQKYKALAAGADHSMALTEEGAVYVWGGGSEGQLGLEGTTECTDPRELQFEERITCISCGYYHSAFVTESGDLYTFGESEQGKLGLGDDPDDTDIPQKVSLPEKVKSVACGGSHTVVLTESGRIYTFGDGSNGQLGHGNHCMQCSTPRLLKLKFHVEKIFCGENHTALVSEKGQVYTFGDGRHGKLGLKLESFSNQYLPQKVGRFKNFIVDKVACGGCHMIVLAFLKPSSNGEVESSDEETSEFNGDGTLGDTIQANGSIDMNSSVTARQKRRKLNESITWFYGKARLWFDHCTSIHNICFEPHLVGNTRPVSVQFNQAFWLEGPFKNDLNQTLPALIGVVHKDNPPLHHTVPVPKPRQARQSDSSIIEDVIKAERIERQEAKPAEAHPVEEDIIKPETRNEKSSTVVPKPLPRKQPEPSKKEEESDEEEEESVGSGDEMEDTKHSRLLPQAPVPAAGQMTSSVTKFDSEESEEEKEKEEKEHEAKEEEVKKQKKTKEKKKVKAKIFGSKSKTGLSDDDEDEDEDEEEEEEVKEVVSKTETQKDEETTEAMNTETTEAVKQPLIEKEVENKDEDGEKDSKKDKKDKKDKEKQKNKKKKKGEEENEDKSKEEQEGIVEKKSKKGKGKKDKKKDKKKGNKEEEGGEGEEEEDKEGKNKKQDKKKDKKKDKIKKDDEEKEEKEEKDEKEEKKVEEKKDEEEIKDKPVEPPKKKSRTCTIL